MKVIELAILLMDDDGNRAEQFDLVALPYVPRVGEMMLWNNNLYHVVNVLYAFDTNAYDYNFDASPTTQSSVAHNVSYKVFLKPDK